MRIRTMNQIHEDAIQFLQDAEHLVRHDVINPDALLVRSAKVSEEDLKSATAISRSGAGVNNIPVDFCSDKGIVVFNTPGANANAVKELVIASLIIVSRNIMPATHWVKDAAHYSAKRPEKDLSEMVEKEKKYFVGREIQGATLGVIGLGNIGREVATAAQYLGMKVVAYDPYSSLEFIPNGIRICEDLDELLEKSDYITLHVPSNEKTRGMINWNAVKKMKEEVFLLNFSRGDLIDEDAVINCDKIVGYVTDFPSERLVIKDKVIAMPHIGASTFESEAKCAITAAKDLDAYLREGEITHSVNYPTVLLDSLKSGESRILIHSDLDAPVKEESSWYFDQVCSCNKYKVESYVKESNKYTVVQVWGADRKSINEFSLFVLGISTGRIKNVRVI